MCEVVLRLELEDVATYQGQYHESLHYDGDDFHMREYEEQSGGYMQHVMDHEVLDPQL